MMNTLEMKIKIKRHKIESKEQIPKLKPNKKDPSYDYIIHSFTQVLITYIHTCIYLHVTTLRTENN